MHYGGTFRVPFLQHIMNNIDIDKVKLIHDKLPLQNPLINTPFDSTDVHHTMQRSMLCKLVSKTNVDTAHRWFHNDVMTMDQVHPNASRHSFEDLIIGHIVNTHYKLTYKDRPAAVLAEIFPYLSTQGRGYYSFTSTQGNHHTNEEPEVVVAFANKRGMALSAFTKQSVLMAGRRFGESPE